LLKKSNLVLYDVEQPLVVIGNLADSGVVITIRAWVKSENYWDLFFYMNEAIYIELPSHGVNFPFPQIDVHLTNGNNN
jgi:Small-conductance mechanosensitive channel